MKVLLFFMIFVIGLMAQSHITFKEVTDEEQVRLLNNIEILAQKNFDSFSVRVMGLDLASGSAGKSNCEVLTTIYIALSRYDEAPEQKLFRIDSLFLPHVLRITKVDSIPIIYLSHLLTENVQFLKIKVLQNELRILPVAKNDIYKTE